jgi:hypothetical protein
MIATIPASAVRGRTLYREYEIKGYNYHLFDEGPDAPYGLYREHDDDFVLVARVDGDDAPSQQQVEAYVLRGAYLHGGNSNPARLH